MVESDLDKLDRALRRLRNGEKVVVLTADNSDDEDPDAWVDKRMFRNVELKRDEEGMLIWEDER